MLSRVAALPALVTALLGLAVLAVPPANAAGGGETLQVAVPGTVSCTLADATALGDDTTLPTGARIECTIGGFAAMELIDVALDPGGNDLGTISANAQGSATFDFTVPANAAAGARTLSFTGETSKGVASFPFTVGLAAASGGGSGSGGGTGTGSGPGHLVFTGVAVLGPVVAGVLLIGGGAALTMSYRRRRRHG